MLKFRKKKSTEPEKSQGFNITGNALQRLWLVTLLVILLPLTLGFSYLLLVREPATQALQIHSVSATYALQQAGAVQRLFQQYSNRLRGAAFSPLALAAIAAPGSDNIRLVERAMQDYFPNVLSLRLIPIGTLGTANLEGRNQGLRNHIEVDLLRRTAAGEQTQPDSYRFEERWLTSLAELVVHPSDDSKRAVILISLDNVVISDTLAHVGADHGRTVLQQIYRKGNFTRADEIALAGNGGATEYAATKLVEDTPWQVVYTPSQQLLSEMRRDTNPLWIVLGLSVFTIIAGVLAALFLSQRQLTNEVDRIAVAADKKSTVPLQFPQLLPLAKQLRRATLRGSRPTASSRRSEEPQFSPNADGLSDPMFQRTDIIDDGDDDLGIIETEQKKPKGRKADPNFPDHIFRPYDIRGIVESELSDDLVRSIGRAIGSIAGEAEQQAVIVGCDGRHSSPQIVSILVKALLDTGRDVINIGVVPTPLAYYAANKLSTQSCVMVTGSDSPPQYNGFKIVIDGHTLAGEDIEQLRDRVIEGKFSDGAGRLVKQDITKDYMEEVVSDVAIAVPLKIVIDAGNGVTGALAPPLFEELGCEVIPLYCEVDGSFPNHPPDTSDESTLADLIIMVKAEGADFGVAFNGDGDRLAVVTADGDIVRTDKLLMLFALDVVSRNPGADVVFDVKCSRHLTQLVSRNGGRPILWKTGHAFMKAKMKETNALLGGEFSGHIFFGERWYGFDDGMYAAARLAEILSMSSDSLATVLAQFPDTESTPEIHVAVAEDEKFDLMDRIASNCDFSPGKINTLDGIRVDYNDGWGLVRVSNTSASLMLRFEAHDTDALERIKQQFREQITAVAADLELGF